MNRRDYLVHSGIVTGAIATTGCLGFGGGGNGDGSAGTDGGGGDGDGGSGDGGGGGSAPDPVADARDTLETLLDQYESSAELLEGIDDDGRVEIEINALASNVSDLESAANGLGDQYEAEADALLAAVEYLDPVIGGLEDISAGTGSLITGLNDLTSSEPGVEEQTYADAVPILDEADTDFAAGVETFETYESDVGNLSEGGNALTGSDISRLQSTHETIQSQTLALNSLSAGLREYANGAGTHAQANAKIREAREALGNQDPATAESAWEEAERLMNEAAETLDSANSVLEGTDPSAGESVESKMSLITCRSGALRDASRHFAEAADVFLQAGDVEDEQRGEELRKQHVEAVNEGAEDVLRCESE